MKFIETRGNDGQRPTHVSFSEAILAPMCSFGGIYAPEKLPDLGLDFLPRHLASDYKQLAKSVLDAFDIVAAAGGGMKCVVREFTDVAVIGSLRVDLTSRTGGTILCGVEFVRGDLTLDALPVVTRP